jgi:hypothetical protein
MPLIHKSTIQKYKKIKTDADYNLPTPVLKDILHIVSNGEETSKIVNVGFKYNIGFNELEVYLNGQLLKAKELYNGTYYGDYEETSAFSITFDDDIISENDHLRFRVTSHSYDYSQYNSYNIQQIGKDIFGDEYSLNDNGDRSDRTIGIITDGDSSPDLSDYHT